MIINLRGTNGSGKSTAVKTLMSNYPFMGASLEGKTMVYKCSDTQFAEKPDLYVLGKYETACGGCDTIKTVAEVIKLVQKYRKKGNVVFEGILISTTFGAVGETFGNDKDFVFAFLDTPLDECIKRVLSRRKEAGNKKPFNPKGLTDKFNTMVRLKARLEDEMYRVETIDYNWATLHLSAMLE